MVDDNDKRKFDYSYSPERQTRTLIRKVFIKLPASLRAIYREVVEALNNNLFVLCAAGLRALIEGICEDKSISGRNLQQKIDNLTDILPPNIVTNLHSFRFLGNRAVHQLSKPKEDELRLAIEISEDLLNYLYELDYKASRLHKKLSPPSAPDGSPPKPAN